MFYKVGVLKFHKTYSKTNTYAGAYGWLKFYPTHIFFLTDWQSKHPNACQWLQRNFLLRVFSKWEQIQRKLKIFSYLFTLTESFIFCAWVLSSLKSVNSKIWTRWNVFFSYIFGFFLKKTFCSYQSCITFFNGFETQALSRFKSYWRSVEGYRWWEPSTIAPTAQQMKFSIKNFFRKCDQIRSILQIWSHSLKKFLMEKFITECPAGHKA